MGRIVHGSIRQIASGVTSIFFGLANFLGLALVGNDGLFWARSRLNVTSDLKAIKSFAPKSYRCLQRALSGSVAGQGLLTGATAMLAFTDTEKPWADGAIDIIVGFIASAKTVNI